jgi:prepilin-type N-terminal cleavage/methylation domain-containing protein
MKNFRKMCRGEKGFTLIELLVVIIILGVLAAVVTLAVTRFIGKGVLESANAELVTVQAAVESALAEGNSATFDEEVDWTGSLLTSPTITDGIATGEDATAYAQMRTHKLKATYTVSADGEVTFGDVSTGSGSASTTWGATKIMWDTTDDVWVRYEAAAP